MSNELAMTGSDENMTLAQIKAGVNLIQEVMRGVMLKDVHYGVVPGCGDKPTLLKPGAEKLLSTFRIAVEPEIQDLSGPDEFRVRVIAKGTYIPTGRFLGSGVGEGSSNEDKWKWKGAVSHAEFEATPEDRRRIKYLRDGRTIEQVRTNPADLANTILKMTKKRALVDLTLQVTAASDIFAQDLEEIAPETPAPRQSTNYEKPQPKAATETPRKEAQAKTSDGLQTVEFVPASYGSKEGGTKDKPWTRYYVKSPQGVYYSTFDSAFGEMFELAHQEKKPLEISYMASEKGNLVKEAMVTTQVEKEAEEVPF